MCIAFIWINPDPNGKYKLVIMDNRDEFLDRETSELQWKDGILGGIDEKDPAKGTWMGVDKYGRVGILLSITQPAHTKNDAAVSRGAIPKTFLQLEASAQDFVDHLQGSATKYNGFQFLALERDSQDCYELHSLTNLFVDVIKRVHWPSGIYVLGNSPPSAPFKKVNHGFGMWKDLVERLKNNGTEEDWIKGLLEIGTNKENFAPDDQISMQTGRPEEYNKPLCSIFIRFPHESKISILLVDKDNNVTYYEKRMADAPEDISTARWSEKTESFKLSNKP